MKKTKILALALCLTCVPVYGASTGAGSDSSALYPDAYASPLSKPLFTDAHRAFAAVYPGTMKGHDSVNEKVVAALHRLSLVDKKGIRLDNPDLLTVQEYHFSVFFNFMNALKTRVSGTEKDTTKFRTLWGEITAEAQASQTKRLTDPYEIDKDITYLFMYTRGLLLASGGGSEGEQDLLSDVPGISSFFGALRDTPVRLLKEGEATIPAWQHSSLACVINSRDKTTKGSDIRIFSFNIGLLNYEIVALVRAKLRELGLPKKAYLPMLDFEKIGITTLIEMWLKGVFPIPITHKEYDAHGFRLGSAVAAMHDKSHGMVDNRRNSAKQAVINLLIKAAAAGKNPRTEALSLASAHIAARYNALNETLCAYVNTKQLVAIEELTAAKALAPDDASDPSRKTAELQARKRYNVGVAALFHALHEAYAMKTDVLEAPTLADALKALVANATDEIHFNFNELETFFNPKSDLTDEQIFEKLKSRTLASIGIYSVFDSNTATLGEYVDMGKLDLSTLEVSRGPVYTRVSFDEIETGKRLKTRVITARYAVDTYADENAVLGLIGKKVPELGLDLERLGALPQGDPERLAALTQVETWVKTVIERTNDMVKGLAPDVLTYTPSAAIAAYDGLVAEQTAEWEAFAPVIAASAASVTD